MIDFIATYGGYGLSALGITGMLIVGRRNAWGWLLALISQCAWATYIAATGQWPLMWSTAAYAAMYIHNFRTWRKEQRATTNGATMPRFNAGDRVQARSKLGTIETVIHPDGEPNNVIAYAVILDTHTGGPQKFYHPQDIGHWHGHNDPSCAYVAGISRNCTCQATTWPTIVRSVQTCEACPSQWDAWTDTGQYLYLRYRGGRGTVDAYPNNDVRFWGRVPDGQVARFEYGGYFDGEMPLAEFCHHAGLTLDPNGDHT